MGAAALSMMDAAVFGTEGHSAIGPSDVAAQSRSRMRPAISPPRVARDHQAVSEPPADGMHREDRSISVFLSQEGMMDGASSRPSTGRRSVAGLGNIAGSDAATTAFVRLEMH